jgi:hypothetical protein
VLHLDASQDIVAGHASTALRCHPVHLPGPYLMVDSPYCGGVCVEGVYRGPHAPATVRQCFRRSHSLTLSCIRTAGSLFVCLSVVCPAGYCQITCGRCSCCPTLLQAAVAAGLTEFAWAMNRSTSNVESLAQPGLIATVMAPDDNAMRTLFDKLGEPTPLALSAMVGFILRHAIEAVSIACMSPMYATRATPLWPAVAGAL